MKTKKKSIAIAAVLIALTAVLLAVFMPYLRQLGSNAGTYGYMDKDLKNVDNVVLLAHCVEIEGQSNSVAGFKEAVRQGANAVSVDLCFKPDGTPVITDNYENVNSAPLLENLLMTMKEEKFAEINVFLNIVQFSGFSALNKLVSDYELAPRLAIIGIDSEHYELIKANDTIVPVYLDYKLSADELSAIEDGSFETPSVIAEYGADGLVIPYSDCKENVIDAFDDFGIPTVVDSVDSNSQLCSALYANAQTVYVKNAESSRKLLDKWIASMQERYQSSIEKSLEDLSKKH